jgi:hypothetical protein
VAWRNGWPADQAQFTPTYFATSGHAFADLAVEDDRLVAGSDDLVRQMRRLCGATEIHTREYDAFLLVGLSIHPILLQQLYSRHRLREHATHETQVISRAALDAAVTDAFRRSIAFRTIEMLRSVTQAPIAFAPEPLLSTNVLEHEDAGRFWKGKQAGLLAEVYADRVAHFADELNIIAVFQPPDTIIPPGFTNPAFSNGVTIWSDRVKNEREHRHMNAAFGTRMLECALPKLLEELN